MLPNKRLSNLASTVNSLLENTKSINERAYRVQEDGNTVFKVESNGIAWSLHASRKKTIDELLHYMNMMMVGREPEGFDYVLNEDMIEWID